MFLGNKRRAGDDIMNATIKKSGNFLRKIKGGEDMKLRWRRGIAALLTAVVLLSMPGGLELTAAATETVQETVSKRNSEYDLVMDTSGQMIVGYTGEPVDLVIPEGTVSIGDRAFQNCTTLASVQFPDSLEEVGVEAFTGCTALSSVKFGSGLKVVGGEAFSYCTSLKSLTLPEGVTEWGIRIFRFSGLTSLTLPQDMKVIPDNIFEGSRALESISLPDGATAIGQNAFTDCRSLRNVEIPESVTTIGAGAFSSCTALKELDLPSGLTTIANQTFSYTGLVSLDIPENVRNIDFWAFSQSYDLTSVRIPNPMTKISESAFDDCTPANITIWCTADSYAYTFALKHGHPIRLIGTEDTRQVSATVQSPEGTVLTEGFTVSWYDVSTGQQVAVGASATLPDAFKTYECRLLLGDELSCLYETPAPQTVEPEDSGELVFSLNSYTAVPLSGTVVDEAGGPVQEATVEITQDFGEQSINLPPLTTEQDGSFSAEISQVPTTVVVRADGYYSARRTISTGGSYDLGEIVLTKTVSDCIQLTLAQVDAVRSGEEPRKRYLPNAAGLNFTLTRDGQPVTGFEIQGTTLRFLPGAVSAGDTIQLSVEDRVYHRRL